MKNDSQAAMQFSGYPLAIADLTPKFRQTHLKAVKPKVNHQTNSVQDSKITNDPKNWDVNWFNGYE